MEAHRARCDKQQRVQHKEGITEERAKKRKSSKKVGKKNMGKRKKMHVKNICVGGRLTKSCPRNAVPRTVPCSMIIKRIDCSATRSVYGTSRTMHHERVTQARDKDINITSLFLLRRRYDAPVPGGNTCNIFLKGVVHVVFVVIMPAAFDVRCQPSACASRSRTRTFPVYCRIWFV